jgi:hypothetical protein
LSFVFLLMASALHRNRIRDNIYLTGDGSEAAALRWRSATR